MGFLDNSSVTVDAVLTKRGREILASGGDLGITKFALSDEEIDYTLWDVTHPNGTDSYGSVIENMSLLEAVPNRQSFRSFLIDQSIAGNQMILSPLNYGGGDDNGERPNTRITLTPDTGISEAFTYTIQNVNVVAFAGGGNSLTKNSNSPVEIITRSITQAASTSVTVTGDVSGLVKIVTINVAKDEGSSTPPDAPPVLGDGGAGMANSGQGAGNPYG